jgi:RNA polymerase sigma factor (sigma-70 family)
MRHNAGMTVAQEATHAGLSPTVSRTAEQLFHEHSGWLYGYCLRLLRSPEEAEDAVQATYLNACRSLRQGTRPRAGSAWLLHIARNVCFTRLRSARRREGVERVGDIAVLEETVAAPDRSYDSLVGLTDALLTLPERQREAILLREWQGLSHGEVAARLDITHSAAETLIFRARRSLAEALENPGRRSRFKAVHALDLAGLLGALKGLLAGSVGAKAAAAITVAAVTTTVSYVAADPPGFLGSERAPAPSQPDSSGTMPGAAVPGTAVVTPALALLTASGPVAADSPASDRPDGGRAYGQATAEAAKDKPKKTTAPNGNANGNGSANGNANGPGSGKALGKVNQPPLPPQSSSGPVTPPRGRSDAAPAAPAVPVAPTEPGPPPEVEAPGLVKDKAGKGQSG